MGSLVPGADGHGLEEEEDNRDTGWINRVWYLIDDENPDPDTGKPNPIITEGGYQLISLTPNGDVPAMFIAPVSTKWVKELQKITLGYNNFYGKIVDSTNADGQPIQLYWYETAVNPDNLYSFLGDEPD